MDWQGLLLGGQGKSPSDYATPYQDRSQIQGYVQQGMGNINGTGPQIDPAQQEQFRRMQMQQAQQLQGVASGQHAGAGELAVQRQMANAQAAQQAAAHMARGGQNAALAYRGAANNQAGIGLAGAGQAQQAAMGDQMNAQNALSGALGQGRSQDISFGGQNANLQQQQYGLNTQRGLGYLGQLTGMDQGQLNAQTAAFGSGQSNSGILGSLINAGGGALAAAAGNPKSDERLKTDITDAGAEVDAMLDRLMPKAYVYKDQKHGIGRRVGIMAQAMQSSPLGSQVVIDAHDGKELDVNKALSAALAATARLNQRLRALESK